MTAGVDCRSAAGRVVKDKARWLLVLQQKCAVLISYCSRGSNWSYDGVALQCGVKAGWGSHMLCSKRGLCFSGAVQEVTSVAVPCDGVV